MCPGNKGKWSVARGINIYHVGNVHQIVMKAGTTERRWFETFLCVPTLSLRNCGAISTLGRRTRIDRSFITLLVA